MDIWAEYEIGLAGSDGARYTSYEQVRKDGIREYRNVLRRSKTVKIFVSNDPLYQTYRGARPQWTSRLHYYGEVYSSNGKYLFKDKGGKVRVMDEKGRFVKASPFGL